MPPIEIVEPPSPLWQEQGRALLTATQRCLWSPAGERARIYLRDQRGLTDATIQEWGIGYNPQDRTDSTSEWGLTTEAGVQQGVWIPRGIVIPGEVDGELWRIKIRRPPGCHGAKYVQVRGSRTAMFGTRTLRGPEGCRQVVVITEGEFDAILLTQEAGDLVAAVTMGSATTSLGVDWLWRLRDARQILIAYDLDEAGEAGSTRAMAASSRMRIVHPLGAKDLTDMHLAGGDLRAWTHYHRGDRAGLRPAQISGAGVTATATSGSSTISRPESKQRTSERPAVTLQSSLSHTPVNTIPPAPPSTDVSSIPVPGTEPLQAPAATVVPVSTGTHLDVMVTDSPTVSPLVRSAQDVLSLVADAHMIGLDLETTGLDPHAAQIRLLTIADARGTYLIDTRTSPDWASVLRPLLEDPDVIKVMHNGKFDAAFLLGAGISVTGIVDTLLAAQLLDGGGHLRVPGHFTLQSVAYRELRVTLDKSLQASDWSGGELSREQLTYAAGDAAILLPLYEEMSRKLRETTLEDVAALEFSVVRAIAWLEYTGAPFQPEAWSALAEVATDDVSRLADEIATLCGRTINLNSTKQLQGLLHDLGIDVQSTAEAVLRGLLGRHPVIPLLLEYRDAAKRTSTYGTDFLKHVHPTTGRIHASYRQIGAATGRMSCSKPNLQQVPRPQDYRRCFAPQEGRVLVKADLSLIELCVVAQLSGDDLMIEALMAGHDLHRITAGALYQMDPDAVTPAQRTFGKSVNFGTLYGQGRRGLIEQAGQQGLPLTDQQAAGYLRRFTQAWPRFSEWQRQRMADTSAIVRTASGRLRRLDVTSPGTVRANTPVQGTAADGFKAGMSRLWDTRDRHPSAVPVLTVHDELVIECDSDGADDVATWVSECLREGMGRYVTRVPVTVEVSISETWGKG